MPEPIVIIAISTFTVSTIGIGIKIIRNIFKKRKAARKRKQDIIRNDLELKRKLLPIKEFDHDDECSICLDLIDNNSCTLKCSHNFHKECIKEWFQQKSICPNCRREI